MSETKIYPAIVIGMGVAGITASIYLSRMGVQPLCFEAKKIGGKINQIETITDYAGFKGTGAQLVESYLHQLEENKIEVKKEAVISLTQNGDGTFNIDTKEGTYQALSVVIASGMSYITPQIDGLDSEEEYFISYNPMDCLEEIKGKEVVVWGNTDQVLQAALTTCKSAKTVYLLLSKDLDTMIDKIAVNKIKQTSNIVVLKGKIMRLINNKESFELFVRKFDNSVLSIEACKLFPLLDAKFQKANTDFIVSLHEIKDDQGNIAASDTSKTFIPGIFAAGDVQQKVIKNIATAILDGAMAGIMAYHYVTDLKDTRKDK